MKPITLAPDEVITAPGLYDIPMERYHSGDLCDGPSVSSSGLRAFMRCPEKWWLTSPLNPERVEQPETTAFAFGRAAHALLIEKQMPRDVMVSPYDSFRTNEAKAWRDEMLADGRTIIKPADVQAIEAMAARLAREPLVKQGLLSGMIEKSLVWKDDATGLWLKARPDVIPQDSMLADYKTAASADPSDIQRDVAKYGYHQQIALAAEGMARVLGRVVDSFALVVQEKDAPYTVTVAPLYETTIEWGARLNRMGLDRLAACLKSGDFPGYSEGPVSIGLPAWAEKQLKDNDALLPQVPSLKEMAAHG